MRKHDVLEIHRKLIDQFSGTHGVHNDAALDSAITAAENRAHYENADIAVCAATYAFHLTKAHAFIDGNKRIGAAAAEIFVEINGMFLNISNDDLFETIMNIAKGEKSREEIEGGFPSGLKRMTRTLQYSHSSVFYKKM